ncbi:MAG: hypothetical protein AAFW81_09515, partial [Pseudomonadota bacterium]
ADHNRMIALGGLAAALDVDDSQYSLYPAPGYKKLGVVIDDYRRREASFFRRDWGDWLGAPATLVLPPAQASVCEALDGEASLAPLAGGGHRVAARIDEGPAPLWIAIVDGDGRIAGLARKGERFRAAPLPPIENAGYAGFARLKAAAEPTFLAVVEGSRSCGLRAAPH